MSFVFAERKIAKFEEEFIPVVSIYGDTKITMDDRFANKSNWSESTFELVKKYGILKTMIIEPRCCIAFAGNDIMYAHKLLEYVYTAKRFTDEELWKKALEIHQSAPNNAVEFILCTIDDQDDCHIACVKGGTITHDCQRAWIGSPLVYQELTKQLDPGLPSCEQYISSEMINNAIEKSKDDSVGGILSHVRYSKGEGSFVYSFHLEKHEEKDQIVHPGEPIIFHDAPEYGGFSFEIPENNQLYRLDFFQADCSLVYTNTFRLPDSINNSHIRYFMLPILCQTSTGKVLQELTKK